MSNNKVLKELILSLGFLNVAGFIIINIIL